MKYAAALTLAVLLSFTSVFAAIAHVQSPANGATSSGVTSLTLAFASNVTAGNMILVSCMVGDLSTTPTISDTKLNTYPAADVTGTDVSDGGRLFLHHAYNIAGGADTVNCSISPATVTIRLSISEFSGAATTNAFDKSSNNSGTGTAVTNANVTPTQDGELFYASVRTGGTNTCTAGTDYTLRTQVPAAPNSRLCAETYVQPTIISHGGSFTLSGSVNWASVMATYKAAATTNSDVNFFGGGI